MLIDVSRLADVRMVYIPGRHRKCIKIKVSKRQPCNRPHKVNNNELGQELPMSGKRNRAEEDFVELWASPVGVD